MYRSSRPFHGGRLLDNCYKIHSEYPSGWANLWGEEASEYLVQLCQYFKNQNILGEQIFPAQGELTLPSKLSQAEMSTRVLCEVEMVPIKRKGLPNSAAPSPGGVAAEEGPRVHVAACPPRASSRSPAPSSAGARGTGIPSLPGLGIDASNQNTVTSVHFVKQPIIGLRCIGWSLLMSFLLSPIL